MPGPGPTAPDARAARPDEGLIDHARDRGNLPQPADAARRLRGHLGRDDAVDRLDDHGRPPPPLEGSPARVPPGRGRPSSRPPRQEKLEAQAAKTKAEIDRARRQDRRRPSETPRRTPSAIRAGRREIAHARRRVSSALDTREAVPEGRARQPAQPLRRHDRPRARTAGRGSTSTRRSSPTEEKLLELSQRARGGPSRS